MSVDKLVFLVDWFSCTFKDLSPEQAINLLGFDLSDFEYFDYGRFYYKEMYRLGNIEVLFGGNSNMGVHVNLSGQACRQLEDYKSDLGEDGFDWIEFFSKVRLFGASITRLDLAIDDFHGALNVSTIRNKFRRGHVTSKLRTTKSITERLVKDGSLKGQTVYLGNTDVIIRFYDKLQERTSKGFIVDDKIKHWVRTEVQLNKEKANIAVDELINNNQLASVVSGILSNYVNFRVYKKNDSRKSRWPICKWWTGFLGECEKIKLSNVTPERDIVSVLNWVEKQVKKSLAVLYKAFDDDVDFLNYLISAGTEDMKKEDYSMIENFADDKVLKQFIKEKLRNGILEERKINKLPATKEKDYRIIDLTEEREKALNEKQIKLASKEIELNAKMKEYEEKLKELDVYEDKLKNKKVSTLDIVNTFAEK